jgi:hypothetical protein
MKVGELYTVYTATGSNTQTSLDLLNTTLGYGFHIQHRNSTTFPVKHLGHDSGRTLVSAEYGYP